MLPTPPILSPHILFTLLLLLHFRHVQAHGQLCEPLPRGQLRGTSRARSVRPVDRTAPIDHFAFFPAGSKSSVDGAGKRSQERAVHQWTPFEPMRRDFYGWRAGVCSDLKHATYQPHLKGGIFYHHAEIVRTYRAGAIVNFRASVNTHHNGYFEFHVCNVAHCPGGEISPTCFRSGACRRLRRARNPVCDSGHSPLCGPIDRWHTGRWYLPCPGRSRWGGLDNYGFRGEMRYIIPRGFTCRHCVLHFYHTSANNCNPPGVRRYFEGPDRPHWGQCRGQSGAIGGFAAGQKNCGGRRFPEEYYACADVRIIGRNAPGGNPIGKIEFGRIDYRFSHNIRRRFLPLIDLSPYKRRYVWFKKSRKYSIRVTMRWPVNAVYYTVRVGRFREGKAVTWRGSSIAPFFVFGWSRGWATPWSSIPIYDTFKLTVMADGYKKTVTAYFAPL